MKVLMVARQFPVYHPKAGHPTEFVEKILIQLVDEGLISISKCAEVIRELGYPESHPMYYIDRLRKYECAQPKPHTIRAGARFNTGDMASLKVWSGRPYWTSPIEFAQVKIIKTIPVDIYFTNGEMRIMIDGNIHNNRELLAKNDGLELADFYGWFQKPMSGQIICFSDVNY